MARPDRLVCLAAALLLCASSRASAQTTRQCAFFNQVMSGVQEVTANPDTVWLYALPADCPDVCTICSAGCLMCVNSGWSDATTVPDKDMPYSTAASGDDGAWLALDTSAVGKGGACVPGGGVGAVTGSLVRTSGLAGTYSQSTGTRVSSKTSSCGVWEIVEATPVPPAPPGGYSPSPPPPPPAPPSPYDWQLPDAVLTPGDTNPDVDESTMDITICCSYRGKPDCDWSTGQIRPPASYTTDLKIDQLAGDYSKFVSIWGESTSAYGAFPGRQAACAGGTAGGGRMGRLGGRSRLIPGTEEDHLIPLELGGNPRSRTNLWPQPHADSKHGSHQAQLKDQLEGAITVAVCAGETPLRVAQAEIASHWPEAYRKYVLKEPPMEPVYEPPWGHSEKPSAA